MPAVETNSPAQVFAFVIGVLLVIGGIIGFFYEAAFSTGDSLDRAAALGILDVNGWHNTVHLLTGIVGLLVVGSRDAARAFALVVGIAYTLLGIVGLAMGDDEVLFSLIPLNTEDNILHLLIGFAGIAAYGAGADAPDPSTT